MTDFDRWLKAALHDAMHALADSLASTPDLTQALSFFFDEEHNPLGLHLPPEDRDFLAAHILSRTQAQNSMLHSLLRNDQAALNNFLYREDSAPGRLRRDYLKDLPLANPRLPEDVLHTLTAALPQGASAHEKLFAQGDQLKAALSSLNYTLLRSGLLPEAYDDVHADALIAGVCAMVDVLSALSSVSEKQTTFAVTHRMLRCAYLAFLLCACEGALTPDLAYLLSACTNEKALELPEELARALVKPQLLDSALKLAAEQLPMQLQLIQESEALMQLMNVPAVPAEKALSAAGRLIEKQAAVEPPPFIAAAPTVFADEPDLPDDPVF